MFKKFPKYLFLILVILKTHAYSEFISNVIWTQNKTFKQANDQEAKRHQIKQKRNIISGRSVFFNVNHITCYGHAMLEALLRK